MNEESVMKKSLLIPGAILCLVSMGAGALLFSWVGNRAEPEEAAEAATRVQLESSREALREAEARAEKAEQRAASLQEQLSAMEIALEQAIAETASVAADEESAEGAPLKKPKPSMAGFLEAMQKDPAMKQFMAKQQEAQVDRNLGGLFAHLDLPEEEETRLRELLIAKQTLAVDQGLELMNKDLSEEERSALTKQLVADERRIRGEIKSLLGEEAFEQYQLFERSQPERQHINSFKQSLMSRGLELSYDSEVELMTAMYEARKDFKYTVDLGDQSNPNSDVLKQFNEENIEKSIQENRALQEKVLESVSTVLSPEQLEVFRESQETQATMRELGMRMGAKMISDGEGEE
jgi:hypothetical protein